MYLKEQPKVETNISGSSNYGIEISDKTFEILSTFYKNPKRSMIRELAANAWDAHLMVNKTHIPFKVYLPTTTAQELTVRDFGPGMNDEEIKRYFCTYFASTKLNTPQIGGYGLGCKIPFAFTSSFTVTSYQNGTATTYVMFKDQDRPKHNCLGSTPTDEPDGLSITVPADSGIFDEDMYALAWFPTPPEIIGGTLPKIDVFHRGPDYMLERNNFSWGAPGVYVVQNCICYATDIEGLARRGIITYIQAKPDEYKVHVSREHLEFDSTALKNRVAKIEDEYFKTIKTKIVGITDPFEQIKFYCQNSDSFRYDKKYIAPAQLKFQHINFGYPHYSAHRWKWHIGVEQVIRKSLVEPIIFVYLEPGQKFHTLIAKHFYSSKTVIFVKANTFAEADKLIPDLIDGSKHKLPKQTRAAHTGSMYEGFFLFKPTSRDLIKSSYDDAIADTTLPVEFYDKKKGYCFDTDRISYHTQQTCRQLRSNCYVIPDNKTMRKRFSGHKQIDEFIPIKIKQEFSDIDKINYRIPSLLRVEELYGLNMKAARRLKALMNDPKILRKKQLQVLAGISPPDMSVLKKITSLYFRIANKALPPTDSKYITAIEYAIYNNTK